MVEIRIRSHMPPKADTNYSYNPKPARMIPPFGGFMHFFHNPKCAPPQGERLSELPKKITGPLRCKPNQSKRYGWGIHFIEEPSMAKVWVFVLLFSIFLFIFAIFWSIIRNDIQGGFGVAAFIAAIGAMVISVACSQAKGG